MTKIISFSGVSNSGKTTLITQLCDILIPDFKVGVIKHDPKNKAIFDTRGKDSYKFFNAGANVALVSPKETAIRLQREISNNDILNIFNRIEPLDYLFIEGFKNMEYRKICVVRDDFDENDIQKADAIATIDRMRLKFRAKKILDLNNYAEILDWINHD